MMCSVNYKTEGDQIVFFLSGRMDSVNAYDIQTDMNNALDANPLKNVIIDLEEMKYIASAGLRVFLQLRKKYPALKIVNVPLEIYEIFQMTGFTEIMDVAKAYRRVKVENCEIIGRGANGIIYRMNPEMIMKAYKKPDALADIMRERELARRAFVLGVPTAISYDIVKVGDGYGAVYELLNASSIAQILAKDPNEMDRCVKLSTDLLKTIHATQVAPDDMPDMKEVVLGWVDFLKDHLSGNTAEKMKALISAVPDDLHMIHGDYHIKNVMIQNGEALLIDMDTLAHGHPIFELAFMHNAFCGFGEINKEEGYNFLSVPYDVAQTFWKKQLSMYLGTDDPEKLTSVEDKARLIGYLRLLRYVVRKVGLDNENGRSQAKYLEEKIHSLADQVDSLVY